MLLFFRPKRNRLTNLIKKGKEMPDMTIPIRNLHYTVERPVLLSIVQQLMDITEISHKTPVTFYGPENKTFQQNSTLGENVAENRWPYDERVFIEVDEDYDMEAILTTPVQRAEHSYIFDDRKLGIFVKPVYSRSKITITVKYRALDENQAKMWRNGMRTRASMMRDLNLHEADYHYNLPDEVYQIIHHLHTLRENVDGYGDSFNEYFTENLVASASIITDVAGKNPIWGIKERQIRIQGHYDFEGAPEKGDKEDEHDNWAISFNYILTYDKPVAINFHYPLIVHNQLIDDSLRSHLVPYKLEDNPRRYSASTLAFSHFESDHKSIHVRNYEGINIPDFDEFKPAMLVPTSIKVLTALTTITAEDKRYLFNLKELGDTTLHPKVIEFLAESEYPHMTKDFMSIFCLSLYRDNQMQKWDTLIVNANLDVFATRDLKLRETYHVRLSLISDLTYLPIKAIKRLQNYPEVGMKIIASLNDALSGLGGHKDIGKNKMTDEEQKLILGKLPANWKREIRNRLVQEFFVQADSV